MAKEVESVENFLLVLECDSLAQTIHHLPSSIHHYLPFVLVGMDQKSQGTKKKLEDKYLRNCTRK